MKHCLAIMSSSNPCLYIFISTNFIICLFLEIILKIARCINVNNIFRPIISADALDPDCNGIGIVRLIEDCWAENPDSRPTVKNVLKRLLKMSPFKYVDIGKIHLFFYLKSPCDKAFSSRCIYLDKRYFSVNHFNQCRT